MSTDTSESGLERRICKALTGRTLRRRAVPTRFGRTRPRPFKWGGVDLWPPE